MLPQIFLGAWLDGDDDLISAEVKLCVNLPSDIFKLLGINLNDMKINVNVGEALNSALEEIDNGIAKSYFVRNKMTNSQGIIQVKLSIRGIEPEYIIQAPPSYRFDTLWNQSNNIVAIYERGNSTYARYCESILGDNRIKVDKVSSCNGN